MFEVIDVVNRTDGIEMCTAWVKFDLDNRGLIIGTSITLENDYREEKYRIFSQKWTGGAPQTFELIEKGNDDCIPAELFKKWLNDRGYDDAYYKYIVEHPEYAEKYPEAVNQYFKE